jgi:NAD(P)-dependent dehydrogenase (short-subunit alcohol dehydrogenase family)
MDPNGRVALITGGARIGQVVAATLANRGCSLALTYRDSRDAAEITAQAARAAGVKATVLRADATNEAEIIAAVNETVKTLGRLDILINMAAVYQKTPNPDSAHWSAIQDANAKSAFLYSLHSAPFMKQSGAGRIVNFSDWLPVTGRPHYKDYVPYYVSKASVAALTEAMALQLAPEILVNAIAPGPILAPPDLTAEENAQVLDATPLARWGGADEIAKTVMFFVETDFVTGEFIRVDGGRHLF